MNIKIELAQQNIKAGHPQANFEIMKEMVEKAKFESIDLIIFPEMAIPGYLIGDEWEKQAFLKECQALGEEIKALSEGISIIFGNIAIDESKKNEDGRVRKYNALFMAEDKKFIGPSLSPYPYVIKSLQPNYREFDDSRYFFSLRNLAREENLKIEDLISPIKSKFGKLACALCEDAWDHDYQISPLSILSQQNPDIYINISCSPFTFNKNHKRNRVFSEHANSLKKPIIYVNNIGSQNNGKTIYIFDGKSCVYFPNQKQLSPKESFSDKTLKVTLKNGIPEEGLKKIVLNEDQDQDLFKALQYGTKAFLKQIGINKVTIGISGGIDSALAAAIYSTILPKENILLVNMPSRFNSETTKNISKEIAKNIGCYFTEITIEESISLSKKQFDSLEIRSLDGKLKDRLKLSDFIIENIQARDRSSRILAALSASFGSVFTCNANKSETTIGYSTLYGDHGGFFANLADLWKNQVFSLCHYINNSVYKKELIPSKVFEIPPSAELSNKQDVDKGQGDPLIYEYHDKLFQSWVEWWDRVTPEEILHWYHEGNLEKKLGYSGDIDDLFSTPLEFIADLEKWWRQYKGMAVAKRIQAPPILALTRRAFGFDHRESQMGVYYSQKYLDLKSEIENQANVL